MLNNLLTINLTLSVKMIALNLSERRKIFKTPRYESKMKKRPQSKKNKNRTPEIFKTPRNESKMKKGPQSKNMKNPALQKLTPHDQVFFKTFRKPRMAALCGRVTPNDQVDFTKIGGPLFAVN